MVGRRLSHRRCPPSYWSRGGGGYHPMETSLLLRIPVGRAASLTMGGLQSMVYDEVDGNVGNGCRGRGGGQRRQVPIFPPWHPPVPGTYRRLPSPSEGGAAVESRRGMINTGLSRSLLCESRGPGPLLLTND